MLLAKTYEKGMNVSGYWMSEKLDGIRALWDYSARTFRSRNGNTFAAPTFFTEKLPDMPLDGELWVGRAQFDRASSIVRSSQDKGWNDVKFMIFDIPMVQAGPFEDRIRLLNHIATQLSPQHHVLTQIKCENTAMLENTMDKVVMSGGEGIMLRKPGSYYEHKRSSTLLKYKRFLDAEAIVTGYQPGKGRNVGQMGALQCVLPNGAKFEVGTGFTDRDRAVPPPIGSTITFKYQELTKSGVPRFPSFDRVRLPCG